MGDVFQPLETLGPEGVQAKMNADLGLLQRNLKACPPKLRETAYFSLVR